MMGLTDLVTDRCCSLDGNGFGDSSIGRDAPAVSVLGHNRVRGEADGREEPGEVP